ncbi:MAG: LptA/OstA family protein [Bdellovibrionota bacterium]|nr:MAG: LptA/OstA family protein [Bdellovibrionota bacterium]
MTAKSSSFALFSFALQLFLLSGLSQAAWAEQPAISAAQGSTESTASNFNLQDGPTFIKADTLTLNAKERTFQYAGNVEVIHGDLTILSDLLDGNYTESNQIKELVASKNVNITKGETIKAICEKAVYTAGDETILLSENPELQDQGSVLTADSIRILLKENRSVAEGQVRVKVIEKDKDSAPLKLPGRR